MRGRASETDRADRSSVLCAPLGRCGGGGLRSRTHTLTHCAAIVPINCETTAHPSHLLHRWHDDHRGTRACTHSHERAHTHALYTTTATAGPRRSIAARYTTIPYTHQYRCRRGLLYTRLLHPFYSSARWPIIPSPSPPSVVVQRARAFLRLLIRFEPFDVSVLFVFPIVAVISLKFFVLANHRFVQTI